MKLEPTNIVCPVCGNTNYMRHLIGKNVGHLDLKCINCNSYFNFDELYERRIGQALKLQRTQYKSKDGEGGIFVKGKELTTEELLSGLLNPKPITNADYIRSMTDEELADFYFRHSWGIADQWCTPSGERCRHEDLMKKMDEPQCKLCFLDWLKQEVSDETMS